MRQIYKRRAPASLVAHRLTRYSDYDNYSEKLDLRHALVSEQRGLCCYCMCRIRSDAASMKIEHWRSQLRYPEHQLDYENLLASCRGGEGRPLKFQHCDTLKSDRDLRWNPANRLHHIESRVYYALDGSILADDALFDSQLNDVLNLNHPQIKNSRKGILDGLLLWWRLERGRFHAAAARARIERKADEWTRRDGELPPFCRVAVWWLRQKL